MAEQPRASTPATAVAAALGATLLVVLLATWAASIGPDDVFRGEGLTRIGEAEEPTPSPSDETRPPVQREQGDRGSEDAPGWVLTLAALAQIATVCVLAYLAYRALRWTRRLRRERRARPQRAPDLAFDVLDEPERVLEAIVADGPDQRAELLEGAPRNAIVACWHRFEIQSSSVGVAREPWETSSEFTLRLLDLVSAEPNAVSELALLYREARFSDHELGEEARARALEALDSLHRQLARRLPRAGAAR